MSITLNHTPEHVPEFTYEEGLTEVRSRTLDLLRTQNYVVVGVGGTGVNVGKTRFSCDLSSTLQSDMIPVGMVNDIEALKYAGFLIGCLQKQFESDLGVVILSAHCSFLQALLSPDKRKLARYYGDGSLHAEAERNGLPFRNIDLRVGIYRPDRPFIMPPNKATTQECLPISDIVIRNEHACDPICKM